MWLLRDGPARRSRVYVNSVLTALDDFHVRRGLGKADVAREDLPKNAPRALEERARIRWLRAVEAHLSPRGIPYYAGARISEVVRLDTGDVQMSARKGRLRLYGKGGKFREVDIHPSSVPSCSSGSTNAPIGPTPVRTVPCSSMPRADG
jgi:integrase